MRVLDLFSGIGGFSLGLERAGMETVAFCEIDPFCQKVLKKHWPDVPCYDDVTKLTKEQLENDGITNISVLTGGIPCQPFSNAGHKKGADDDRHLWPAMLSIRIGIRPDWVICENVTGIIGMELDNILSDLERIEYAAWTFVIPATAVGARHIRDRVWIIANRESVNVEKQILERGERIPIEAREASNGERIRAFERQAHEPGMVRVDDGFSDWVDRSRSLGNAVHPGIPEIIGRAIMEAEL